jgi:hypothetical protein
MKCPPYAVSMRIEEEERTRFRLWFPLFILWPLILALLLVTFILTLLVDLASLVTGGRARYTRFVLGCMGVIGESRGTEIFVQERRNRNRTVALTVR